MIIKDFLNKLKKIITCRIKIISTCCINSSYGHSE